jgi:hypothetical protein
MLFINGLQAEMPTNVIEYDFHYPTDLRGTPRIMPRDSAFVDRGGFI